MKKILSLLVFIPFVCAGCGVTSIVTETPYSGNRTSYRTTVRTNRTNSVTTNVYAANDDISLYLDLQGVAAAFSQASTVKEFESLLNDSSYMLSDLDLNGDGYVDYLRVLETLDGSTHVFLIQAVLGEDVYQDVATLVAEVPASTTTYHVQVIGAPFLYGPDYIIEPVYYTRPAIFVSFGVRAYVAWTFPWRWNYYPTYYTRPVPVHIGHYQAYIGTYMRNHRYCHNVTYVNVYHYTNYNIVCRNNQRNDYIVKHPERSFNNRVSSIRSIMNTGSNQQPVNIRNAKDIRDMHDANKKTTTSSRSQYRRSGNNNYVNNGSNNNNNSIRERQIKRNNAGNNNNNTNTQQSDGTYNKGRVRDSQSATYRRNTETTQRQTTNVMKDKKASSRTTTSTSGNTYRKSTSSQKAAQSSKASTTVTSRVKKSGAANTKVNKVSSTGEKTTYRRK
ncbi:MAG: hypothetical protein MJY76_06905 [Bacteroidales bacterium]|nr:hypothetical protein [Bacteroidales bacterium]